MSRKDVKLGSHIMKALSNTTSLGKLFKIVKNETHIEKRKKVFQTTTSTEDWIGGAVCVHRNETALATAISNKWIQTAT